MPTIITYILIVQGIEKIGFRRLKTALSARYDAQRGYGFSSFEKIEKQLISSSLIYSTIQRERVFDAEGNFVYENRLSFGEVSFEIDLSRSIVLVMGGISKIRRLINVLGTVLDNRVTIEYTHLDVKKTISYMQRKYDEFRIQGVVLQNYSPQIDISGKFSAKVSSSIAAQDILFSYSGDLTEFVGIFEQDGIEVRIRVSNSGIVALQSTDDAIRSSLEILKEIVMETQNA